MFDWEDAIILHAKLGNRESALGDRKVSWFFPSCSGNQRYILELQQGWPFKTRVCSVTSGLLSSYDGHLRNLN